MKITCLESILSHDGTDHLIISGSEDGLVKIWSLKVGCLLQLQGMHEYFVDYVVVGEPVKNIKADPMHNFIVVITSRFIYIFNIHSETTNKEQSMSLDFQR